LLGAPVAAFLKTIDATDVGVVEIDPTLSDTTQFCQAYNITPAQCANCVVLEAKRADRVWYAACSILGSTRIDVNNVARKTLDARKVSFAPMDTAVQKTAMEYGAITPVGLPTDWPILVDTHAAQSDQLIIGSGVRNSKLVVSGTFLAGLPNAQVIQQLAV
jgi:prolyl-tRNA editing enzyme YbaK/EbsC (Cys-tRNA(Pro) deacylase)